MQIHKSEIYQWISEKIKKSSKKRKWQIKEPEDKKDSAGHEKFVQTILNNNELLISASIRGKNHAHQGRWREDDFYFEKIGYFTIIAVADGVGSSLLSRVGAGIACRGICQIC